MKNLVLLRGAPGAGKSTFILQHNLTPYTICPDEIRISIGGIVFNEDGKEMIDQSHDVEVWQEVARLTQAKMQRAERIVIDATFQESKEFEPFIQSAQQYGYQIYCVDFTNVPREIALKQNLLREPYKQVPEQIIHTAYDRFQTNPVSIGITILYPSEFNKQILGDS